MTAFETLRYEVADGLARLTLARPDAMNGMTNQMVREATEALELAAADTSLRVLVLTGEGWAFCPGADLKHFTSGASDERLTSRHFQVTTLLHEIPVVTIAAINGACAGAGLGWALACDLRTMSESAKLNTAFLDVAVAGDMAIPWTLPRLIGAARAREMSFLPGRVTAAEALRIGLVHRVAPAAPVLEDTLRWIAPITEGAPLAQRAALRSLRAAERLDLDAGLEFELACYETCLNSEDRLEALAAFAEKRPAVFKGR